MFKPISAELQAEVEKLKSRIPEAFSKTIDVDEGWYQIVVDCSKAIDAIYPHYKILQIKQFRILINSNLLFNLLILVF